MTKPFNGYMIKLPAGTTLISSKTGKYGDVRTLYKQPNGKYIETIALSADFRYRDFSEEITNANPNAANGNFDETFAWGGSVKGHGEAWTDLRATVDGHGYTYFYLYTSTADDPSNVIVIEYGSAFPSKALKYSIEHAKWTE